MGRFDRGGATVPGFTNVRLAIRRSSYARPEPRFGIPPIGSTVDFRGASA
jgi:hypothetical protein